MEPGESEKLIRVLRSDITGTELRTGYGNKALLGQSEGSSSTPSSPSPLDSEDEITVYTHDNLLSSLAKQLEIQKQVTDICERDLEYRTEIIELLTARIVELETEAVSWKEQKKSFSALKEKMQYLEQLYGGDGARELELAAPSNEEPVPAIPEGSIIVETDFVDSLKHQIDTSNAEIVTWQSRVEELETQLVEQQHKHLTAREDYNKLESTHRSYKESSGNDLSSLEARIQSLIDERTRTENRNSELMQSLDSASDQIKQLTLNISIAEEMRNASLNSATKEAHEYATLRGRLTELEGQLDISHQETDNLAMQLESSATDCAKAKEELSSAEAHVKELEGRIMSLESEAETLRNTIAENSATSATTIADWEAKHASAIQDAEVKLSEWQVERTTLHAERDSTFITIATLEARIQEYESAKQAYLEQISKLQEENTSMTSRIDELEDEVASSQAKYEDLVSASTAGEASSRQRLAELQAKADSDIQTKEIRITELETLVVVIKEECTHHTAELEQAKGSLEELHKVKEELSQASGRVTELEDQLLEVEGRAGGFDAQLSEAQDKIRTYEEHEASHSEAVATLRKEHAGALAEYEGRLADMTSGATTNASRQAALENEVAALTSKITSLEGDLASAKADYEGLKDDQARTSANADESQKALLTDANSRVQSLEAKLTSTEESKKSLEQQLSDLEKVVSELRSQSGDRQSQLETSLKETEEKLAATQGELEEKSSSLEQLELRVLSVSELEIQLEHAKEGKDAAVAAVCLEKEGLQAEVSSLQTQLRSGAQQRDELQAGLEKAKADVEQRQSRIEVLEKEAKEQGGKTSIDHSQLQDLYAEHERQITQMESDYDELRIERDAIIEERDHTHDERDKQQHRIQELEQRIEELRMRSSSVSDVSSSIVSSPTDMTSPPPSNLTLVELQARLQESELKRAAAERALMRRSYSNESAESDTSRESVIIVETIDEDGNSEIKEVRHVGSDGGSETASETTADHSTMAASVSMASTTSSVAEQEAARARADRAKYEERRTSSQSEEHHDEEGKHEKGKHRLSLFRHESTKSVKSNHSGHSGLSIASALSGASKLASSITHGEGHLFPERLRRTSTSSRHSGEHEHHEHHHHHEHHEHHHDMSNPFLLFAGRGRTDSTHSKHSETPPKSGSGSGSGSGRASGTPVSDPISPTKTAAALEREKKAKIKAEKLERERLDKAAKIEAARQEKVEKEAKRAQEKAAREQKEQERKERLKSSNGLDHLTALRQGAGSYYEHN